VRKRVCDIFFFLLISLLRFRMAHWGEGGGRESEISLGLLLMREEEISALEAEVVRLRTRIQGGKMGGRE